MIIYQEPEGICIVVFSNVKAMKVDSPAATDAREVLETDPFDAVLETAGTTCVENHDAVEETAACGIEEINTCTISLRRREY